MAAVLARPREHDLLDQSALGGVELWRMSAGVLRTQRLEPITYTTGASSTIRARRR